MKIILTEDMLKRIITEESSKTISVDDVLKSNDFKNKVKEIVKNDKDLNNESEKFIKKQVSKCVNKLFKTLWQYNNFWTDAIEK